MKFKNFKAAIKDLPYIRSQMFPHICKDVPTLRVQISTWIKQGKLIVLKSGVYALPFEEQKTAMSCFFLANELYHPSYVSLESALSFYSIIPEKVNIITSITSKKTQTFNNDYGHFSYHHIKQNLFNGFIKKTDEFEKNYFIATKEKAVLDYLHLKVKNYQTLNSDYFEKSLRWQNLTDLNIKKLHIMASNSQSKKLILLTQLLIKSIKND